ncbi:3-keto-disaccharide hydrolase [Rhodohalobacter sp. 8-1]|uniref:3-keto-disaccharide hydrolase n=1 Tax=Rhodohalobacter sp. 8-1 TaxID=3131972 RepID=UPI0030EF80EB
MIRQLFISLVFSTLILFAAGLPCVQAQSNGPEWEPELTEDWTPVEYSVETGAPPSDAIVLFDGTDLDEWTSAADDGGNAAWRVEDGAMTVVPGSGNIKTRRGFGDVQLHIEWRTPEEIEGDGQGRGNSGVFLQEMYEVQVLDSWDNETYSNGQAGSVYKQKAPAVNASKAPGEWQTYDIIFESPRFDDNGELIKPAYVTVHHNGVLIHHRFEIEGPTEYIGLPEYSPHPQKLPIVLQDHSNPVSFRNIWIREL